MGMWERYDWYDWILDKVLHGQRLKGFDLKLKMNSRFFFINMNVRVSLRVSRLISRP
jgi:hypothetical protein